MDTDKLPENLSQNNRKNKANEFIEIEIPFNLFEYLNLENCNVQNLCRICLCADNSEMFPLLSSDEELPLMFTSLTTILVHPNEGLPTSICYACKTQVVTCNEFREKCLKSDTTLKSLLKGEFNIKEAAGNISQPSNDQEQELLLNDLKEDKDLIEDVQYLEEFDDNSDNETLHIAHTGHRKSCESNLKLNYVAALKNDLNEVIMKENKRGTQKKGKKLKSHVCTFCSKKFVKLKVLRAHIKCTHGALKHPYSCDQCRDSFKSEHDLQLHLVLHSKGPWTCQICKKEFKARAPLRRHIQRHMESKKYTCEACGKTFAELYALRRHSRVHTGERVEKRFACHLCDKRYSESGLLAAHVLRHSDARPCVCGACGKAFPSPRLLASHRLVHTDLKPYPCSYCDKSFRHESTRNTHHRTHTGEKPYVCTACGKAFIQNSNLTLHMRTHTGERPYTCETCGHKFTSGSSLKSHVRTHTGEKPYSCEICGKRFARLGLRAHMRGHTGERPFPCSVCPRKFVTAARLRDHCRLHTGEKPFECPKCTVKFHTKSQLMKHVKSHNANNKSEGELVVRKASHDQPMFDKNFLPSQVNKRKESQAKVKKEFNEECSKEIIIEQQDMPLEVSGELVLPSDGDIKTDILVVDDNTNYQNGTLCVSGVNFVNNEINYASDMNLVTVNEGEVSISASSSMLEGTTVKLYQLDQSLVQISSSGGQVTISKITSKMTANF